MVDTKHLLQAQSIRDPQTLDAAYKDGMVEAMSNDAVLMALPQCEEQRPYCESWNKGWRAGRDLLVSTLKKKAVQ